MCCNKSNDFCPQSPEKYVLKFAAGTLPKESKRYIIDYQFTDGSVRKDVPVEILGPDVLLVCHPGKYVAQTVEPGGYWGHLPPQHLQMLIEFSFSQ